MIPAPWQPLSPSSGADAPPAFRADAEGIAAGLLYRIERGIGTVLQDFGIGSMLR